MLVSKYLVSFLLVSSFLLLFSCSESTSPELDNSNGLIPLKISNTWNYQFTDYDSSGTIVQTENQIQTIVKDTTIMNSIWYSYNYLPNGFWVTNKTDGYWSFVKKGTGNIAEDTSTIVFKYPTNVGDVYGNVDIPTEVIATNEEITVPAGTFKVIHITTNYQSLNNYLLNSFETYIAPKIGVIKEMQIGKKPNGNTFVAFKRELESYTLK